MAGSVNKVVLIGRLGKDPEIRSFQNGGRVANLSLATSERWKDKTTGEQKERTEWHKIAITNDRLVEVVEKYVRKGQLIYVEGSLATRKWTDQSGQDKYMTEIVLRPFNGTLTMLSKNEDGGGGGARDEHEDQSRQDYSTGGSAPRRKSDALDDDIPF